MHCMRYLTSFLAAAFLLSGCSNNPEFNGGGNGGAGSGVDGRGQGGSGSSTGRDGASSDISRGQGSSSAQGGAQGSGSDNGNVCEKLELDASATPPRVLIIQDLSSSMKGKWQALDDAMVGDGGVIPSFGDQMSLGYMAFSSVYLDNLASIQEMDDTKFNAFFTANDDDCSISNTSIVAPGAGNTAAIIQAYDDIVEARMVGGTPTQLAMTKAMEVLVNADPKDGSAGVAILLTDGAPTCEGTIKEETAAVQSKIEELAAQGVETFVVAYNYKGAALDEWAAAGTVKGTPRSHIAADDTATLNTEMSKILQGLVPCDYELSKEVKDAQFVRVTIDDVDRPLGDEKDGWTLDADKKTIRLGSNVCDEIQGKGNHTVDVVVECKVVIVVL